MTGRLTHRKNQLSGKNEILAICSSHSVMVVFRWWMMPTEKKAMLACDKNTFQIYTRQLQLMPTRTGYEFQKKKNEYRYILIYRSCLQ